MIISGNQQFLRTINRLAVLRAVRRAPGMSRARLADTLKLTRPTIGNIVDELISDGWLAERRLGPTGVKGRRPVALHIDEASRILIGADINGQRSICIASTLGGEICDQSIIATPSGSAEETLDALTQQTIAVWQRLLGTGQHISAMGIGVPGPVDLQAGTLLYSDNTGWHNLHVRHILKERLAAAKLPDFPVRVQRAIGCFALSSFESEESSEEDSLLYIHVGKAVSCAILSRNTLLQGRHGMMGVIGHLVMDSEGPLCSCGKRGCANVMVTLGAIENATGRHASEFSNAAESGDAILIHALHKAGLRLGTLLYNLSMQFDPARIYVGGLAPVHAGPIYINAARESFYALHAKSGHQLLPPRIDIAEQRDNAVALGAATGALFSLVHTNT